MNDKTNARDAIRVFVAADRSRPALERVRRFLDTAELQIRTNAPRRVDASLYAADMERSFGRMVHGFIAGSDWLGAHGSLQPAERRDLVGAVVSLVDLWRRSADPDSSMAFHDETTAQRVINLVGFHNDYSSLLSEEQDTVLRGVIDRDVSLLASDDFYAGTNNHGMFQDIALLVTAALYSDVSDPAALQELAFRRLKEYFSTCFTSDGIHVENNPTYHVMISRYLTQVLGYARALGVGAEFEDLSHVLEHAEEYAAHAVAPQGMFPPVSDTAVMTLNTAGPRSTYPGELFLGAVTLGEQGELPQDTTFVAEQTGYAIHRSRWSDPGASYVFFSAAYNANYHKHSDELSLYVANDGVELLREAGPFGYDRNNPFTGHGFSSGAHNTLLVDGRGLPRTDSLRERTTLQDLGSTGSALHVRGRTRRFDGVDWVRELEVDEAGATAPVRIRDVVRSADEHEYQFLWHFGPSITPLVRGNVVELFTGEGRKVGELSWSGTPSIAVRTIRGQHSPEVQGWAFPTMGQAVPASVLSVSITASDVDVAWELRTTEFRIVDRGVNPVTGAWSVFAGEKPVNYLLEVPEGGAEDLAIVFTAIHKPWDFTYNYRSSIDGLKAAKLFVLDDFGDQGAYYLANGRSESEFRSVQGLLQTVLRQLDIGSDRVTTIGSSKGGSSAILHGVAIGAARVIAGAPQTRLGSFLATPHPNILEYIAGGTSAADVAWADAALERALASGVRATAIDIVVGRSDHHYSRHVVPFAATARSLGYAVNVLALPGTPHAKIGAAFRSYLESWVRSRNGEGGEPVLPHAAVHDKATGQIGAVVGLPPGWKSSFKLLRDREVVRAAPYQATGQASWSVTESGAYRFRIYARSPEGLTIAFGTSTLRVSGRETVER